MKFLINLIIIHIFFSVVPLYSNETGEKNLIASLNINKNLVKVGIHTKLKSTYLHDDFFVEYDSDIDLSRFEYEIVTMPFIANVISIIWISGEDYYIDSMEKDFYDSLEKVKKVFKIIYPKTSWNGNLIPRKLVSLAAAYQNVFDESQIACLFSGGIDSTSTSFAHSDKKKVFITAWGQYDSPLDKAHVWFERKKKIQEFAHRRGDTNAFLKSNFSEFLNWKVLNHLSSEIGNWRIGTVEGIGWAGLTAPILLAKGCAHLYLPSSYSWYYPSPGCAIPHVDDNISFAGIQLHHDQFDYARIQKCEFIAQSCKKMNGEKPFIKVCQQTRDKDDTNCCNCFKCLPTIMMFIALGENPSDFGFPITVKTAVARTIAFLQRGVSNHGLWNFVSIQNRMIKKVRENKRMKKQLEPFLKYNLAKVRVTDKEHLHTVDWQKLAEFYPHKEMPKNLSFDLLNIRV